MVSNLQNLLINMKFIKPYPPPFFEQIFVFVHFNYFATLQYLHFIHFDFKDCPLVIRA